MPLPDIQGARQVLQRVEDLYNDAEFRLVNNRNGSIFGTKTELMASKIAKDRLIKAHEYISRAKDLDQQETIRIMFYSSVAARRIAQATFEFFKTYSSFWHTQTEITNACDTINDAKIEIDMSEETIGPLALTIIRASENLLKFVDQKYPPERSCCNIL